MTRFRDRTVLITGASSGIGAQLAREVVDRGGRAGLIARREERLDALARELEESSGRADAAAWAAADVRNGDALSAALSKTAEELGGADVVVANAGYSIVEKPREHKPGRAVNLYDVNLLGMLRTFDWAIPGFVERRSGHLVGISSLASFFGAPGTPSYCGSKAAMRIHLQGLRVTLKKYGVHVTTICPGFVESELTDEYGGKMPFLWKTDRAGRKIADAIEANRGEVSFPWQLKVLIKVFGCLPTSWLEALLSR